jgi:hypothetical protein
MKILLYSYIHVELRVKQWRGKALINQCARGGVWVFAPRYMGTGAKPWKKFGMFDK